MSHYGKDAESNGADALVCVMECKETVFKVKGAWYHPPK